MFLSYKQPSSPPKRTSSVTNFGVPPAKRVRTNNDVPEWQAVMQNVREELLQMKQRLDNAPPINEAEARASMYTSNSQIPVPRDNNRRLARDRVMQWLEGKTTRFPRLSDFWGTMNREGTFSNESRAHFQAILIWMLQEFAKVTDPTQTVRVYEQTMKIQQVLARLTELGPDCASTGGIIKVIVQDLNSSGGNFLQTISILHTARVGLVLRQAPPQTSYNKTHQSNTYGGTNNNTYSKAGSRGSSNTSVMTGRCFHCKQKDHPYKTCTWRLNNKVMPNAWYCAAWNKGACSNGGNNSCIYVHKCYKCSGTHKAIKCQDHQQRG